VDLLLLLTNDKILPNKHVMKRDIQNNKWSCYAHAVAYACSCPVQEVYDFVGHDGSQQYHESKHPDGNRGFDTRELQCFMMSKNKMMGMGLQLLEGKTIKDFLTSDVFNYNSKIDAIWDIESSRIKLTDGSPGLHSVYFSNDLIYDPLVKSPIKVNEFKGKVIVVWPIIDISEDFTDYEIKIVRKN